MYKRILLKLSGEALMKENGIDYNKTKEIGNYIKECYNLGIELAIVVGGGNLWRGRNNTNFDSITSDHIGMMVTIMNALALNNVLNDLGCPSVIASSVNVGNIVKEYNQEEVMANLNKKKIVIFAGGTGHPFFSTDTASALRAREIKADVIIKATNVDGVYTSDPNKNSNAQKLDKITYTEVINKELQVMDLTAITICKNGSIPIIVLNMNNKDNLIKAIKKESIGTIITN